MDYMIWLVAIALLGYVVYAARSAPPSSGCLSADLARARDEAQRHAAARAKQAGVVAVPPSGSTEAVDSAPRPVTDQAPRASSVDDTTTAADASDMPGSSPVASDSLRNPENGEQAAIPTNYRFAKRWIKEAMVREGLLDKVYSNTEIDAELAEKVRLALAAFKAMDKYRG